MFKRPNVVCCYGTQLICGVNMHGADAGMLVSTCYVQLLLAGVYIGAIAAALLHPQFWEMVWRHKWWPISFVLIALWHNLSQRVLNSVVTDGKRIKYPFVWLFSYVALSAGYCVVRLRAKLDTDIPSATACNCVTSTGRGYCLFDSDGCVPCRWGCFLQLSGWCGWG